MKSVVDIVYMAVTLIVMSLYKFLFQIYLKNYLIIIFALAITFSCHKKNGKANEQDKFSPLVDYMKNEADSIHEWPIGKDSVLSIPFEPEHKEIEITDVIFKKLELGNGTYIGTINKTLVKNENLYLLDKQTQSIFIYSVNGDFVNRIAHTGNGPGQYMKLTDFDIKNDNVIIFANAGRKIIHYDLSGNFLKEIKTLYWCREAAVLSSNGYCLLTMGNNYTGYKLLFLDSLGQLKGKALPVRGKYKMNIFPKKLISRASEDTLFISFPFSKNRYAVVDEDSIMIRSTIDAEVFELDHSRFNTPEEFTDYLNDKTSWGLPGSSIESKNWIGVELLHDNKFKEIFFSRKSGASKTGTMPLSDKVGMPFPILSYKGYMISLIPAKWLLDYKADIVSDYGDLEIFDNLSVSSNDVLVFYKLKNF